MVRHASGLHGSESQHFWMAPVLTIRLSCYRELARDIVQMEGRPEGYSELERTKVAGHACVVSGRGRGWEMRRNEGSERLTVNITFTPLIVDQLVWS